MIQMDLFKNRNRLTDIEDKRVIIGGEGRWEGTIREVGTDMYTPIYFKWITHKVLLYRTRKSDQYPIIT